MKILFEQSEEWKLGDKVNYKGIVDVIKPMDSSTHLNIKEHKHYTLDDIFKGKIYVFGNDWEIWKYGEVFQFQIRASYTTKTDKGEPEIGINESMYLSDFSVYEIFFIDQDEKHHEIEPTKEMIRVIEDKILEIEIEKN